MKARNVCFTIIVLAVLFCAIGYKVADRANVLPASLDNGRQSSIEGKSLQTVPEVSLDSILQGTFQDEAEDYLSGCFPNRDGALLANASLQRDVIQVANTTFGYQAVPTFYGSAYSYDASAGTVMRTPYAFTSLEPSLDKSITLMSKIAENNPDTRFMCYMVDNATCSEANPAMSLMSDPFRASDVEDMFEAHSTSNLDWYVEQHDDLDDYLRMYFATDHHWKISGAYAAYSVIAEDLGMNQVSVLGTSEYSDYPFYGASSRAGLCLVPGDYIQDMDFDLPDYRVLCGGKEKERGGKQAYKDGTISKKQSGLNGYAAYYGSDYSRVVYTTEANEGNGHGNLLIVGDSYTNCMEQLFTSTYAQVHVLDLRTYDEGSISQYIASNNIDDVLFIQCQQSLWGQNVVAGLAKG